MSILLKEKTSITKWLDAARIKNYTLVEDLNYGFVVYVVGSVNLDALQLSEIPVKFNIIDGNFSCVGNKLLSLEGSPESVKGNFLCDNNQLTNLKYAPHTVGGVFSCSYNKLKNLEHCPTSTGHFYCAHNEIKTLKYLPKTVLSNQFYCDKSAIPENMEETYDFLNIKYKIKSDEEKQILSEFFSPNKLKKNVTKI